MIMNNKKEKKENCIIVKHIFKKIRKKTNNLNYFLCCFQLSDIFSKWLIHMHKYMKHKQIYTC